MMQIGLIGAALALGTPLYHYEKSRRMGVSNRRVTHILAMKPKSKRARRRARGKAKASRP